MIASNSFVNKRTITESQQDIGNTNLNNNDSKIFHNNNNNSNNINTNNNSNNN